MTTKPRAKKFRIKRNTSEDSASTTPAPAQDAGGQTVVRRPVPLKMNPEAAQPSTQAAAPQAPAAQARPARPQPAAPGANRRAPAPGQVDSAAQVKSENTIDAIRQEGLTGRQLRMARRVAQKNGIAATSDFEAVKLLRDRGIDPFERANALELVEPRQGAQVPAKQGKVQLPQTVPQGKKGELGQPRQPEGYTPERRAMEIREIQMDIAKRRRRKMALLFTRLGAFVGLPTFIMGYYFAFIATPMYSTESAFLIQQAEGNSAAGGLSSMFGNNQLATVQDSIAVQGYLTSREAMLRLDVDKQFINHFKNPDHDSISRLAPDATNEEAFKLYKRHVKIGYDPTEGIIKLEVIAADPETATEFSRALISYAEQQVGDLSQRLRDDQMRGARESFAESESKRTEAATRLVELQTQLGTVNPEGDVAAAQTRIATFETQLEERRLELDAQLANRRPNQARVDGLRSEIRNLSSSIEQQKQRMLQAGEGQQSMASVQAQINIATIDLQTRDALLQQALQAMETARISAERQVRYIALSTPPTAPDKASYPRVFENTVLAFLIFMGIYLMISLTASILREQVSS